MICPYCNRQMEKGEIDAYKSSQRWCPSIPKGMSLFARKKESVKLSSIWHGLCIPAYRCSDCKKIIIDETKLTT